MRDGRSRAQRLRVAAPGARARALVLSALPALALGAPAAAHASLLGEVPVNVPTTTVPALPTLPPPLETPTLKTITEPAPAPVKAAVETVSPPAVPLPPPSTVTVPSTISTTSTPKLKAPTTQLPAISSPTSKPPAASVPAAGTSASTSAQSSGLHTSATRAPVGGGPAGRSATIARLPRTPGGPGGVSAPGRAPTAAAPTRGSGGPGAPSAKPPLAPHVGLSSTLAATGATAHKRGSGGWFSSLGIPAAAADVLLVVAAGLIGLLIMLLVTADSMGAGPRHREWRRRFSASITPLLSRFAPARTLIARVRHEPPEVSPTHPRGFDEFAHN
ncbi:MAG: hypothetical protein QOI03_631 [Solirubrobacteraceae bacterium]|nr:hypothetical protein [Solirubrobacteraceae bacterium]